MFSGIDWLKPRAYLVLAIVAAAFMLFSVAQIALAQTEVPENEGDPRAGLTIHVVQEGENLTVIAQQYEVTVEAIRLVNHLRDADVLFVGRELIIPGGEGDMVAAVANGRLGDSMATIARRFNTTVDEVLEANLLINRDYIPAVGQILSVISHTGTDQPVIIEGFPHIVTPGQTILEIAALYGLSPGSIAGANDLSYPLRLYPGQRLLIPGPGQYQDLPGGWKQVTLRPEQIQQGDTVEVYVERMEEGPPTGEFGGMELHFVPKDGGYAALVGFDAFTAPGYYTLQVEGPDDQQWQQFSQAVPIVSANFINQQITVSEELNDLLAPEIREVEDKFLLDIYSNFSGAARWDGLFQIPVTSTIVTAPYGGGRSYNEGPVTIFHTGTDFSGNIGTPIMAAANGQVVFRDSLQLRGLTVIVDHGMGIMTGYYHLEDAFVEVGQELVAGDPIGLGGSSGLSTGPHLHWELRVMGVPVDPMPWTEEVFP